VGGWPDIVTHSDVVCSSSFFNVSAEIAFKAEVGFDAINGGCWRPIDISTERKVTERFLDFV
jgi:hypothetical protein